MRNYLLVLAGLLPLPAAAQSHTGVITQIRIDSGAGPAVCVATAPELRGTAWACLHAQHTRYREMYEVLLRAFEKNLPCKFEWTQVDSMTNRARIEVITCSSQK